MATNPFDTLKASQRMPSPPGVVVRLLELVQSEDASLQDLAALIGADPALAARILRYVNSPLIGFFGDGISIDEAVARIGMRGTQMIALSFALVSERPATTGAGFDSQAFWARSLAVAVSCRALARTQAGAVAEDAFLVGLLAHLGELLCATSCVAEYTGIALCGVMPTAGQLARERETLGMDRYELCAKLLAHWRLPETLWRPIAELPTRIGGDSLESSGASCGATALLHLACEVADCIGSKVGRSGDSLERVTRNASRLLGLESERSLAIVAEAGEEWTTLASILDVPAAGAPTVEELLATASEYRDMLRVAADAELESLRTENRQLSHLANRDRLTGALNRGAFDGALAEVRAGATNSGDRVCLMMIDLDHFKAVNDIHGHSVGDAVLRHVARAISEMLPARDCLYRFGGEEFAVLIDGLDRAAGSRLGAAICRAIAESVVPTSRAGIRVSTSIGVAWLHECAKDAPAEDLVVRADGRLYEAKRAGRNRCVGGESDEPVAASAAPRSGSWTAKLSRVFSRKSAG